MNSVAFRVIVLRFCFGPRSLSRGTRPRPPPGDQPTVADRRAVGVSRQVLQHLFRSAERSLGVNHPLSLAGVGETALEWVRVCQGGELSVKDELSPLEGGAEQRQEAAAKHAAEDADREEEPRPAGDPMRPVGRDPASGHDAMDVG